MSIIYELKEVLMVISYGEVSYLSILVHQFQEFQNFSNVVLPIKQMLATKAVKQV